MCVYVANNVRAVCSEIDTTPLGENAETHHFFSPLFFLQIKNCAEKRVWSVSPPKHARIRKG